MAVAMRSPVSAGLVPGGAVSKCASGSLTPPEHQTDAHARAEHHGDPGHRAELGLLALGAEVDAAVAAGREPEGRRRRSRRRPGTNAQPPLCIRPLSMLPEASSSESVPAAPQMTNARVRAR